MAEKQLTVMDVLKVLNKSNCRECGLLTCMAFAAMVVQGQKSISECPYVEDEIIQRVGGAAKQTVQSVEERRDELLEELKREVSSVDFGSVARKIGTELNNERLVIRCLGKIFELDAQGRLYSMCHVNSWIHLPIINYVVHGAGEEVMGKWVHFSELKHAKDWVRFFEWRCEKVMQSMVDEDPDLFCDMIDLFAVSDETGSTEPFASADYVFTLYPLPKVPMKIVIWKADEQFDSKLSLFFDKSAEGNLGVEAIYMLCVGFLEMLKRISEKHGTA